MIEGVDYAWSRPDIGQLAAAGKRFACRYGGPGSDGKQLDQAEALALSAAGVAIVANAEGAADGLINGFAAGASWARDAETHFRACGMPAGRPIYFSVDFDTTSGDWDELDAAMDGAASVIGRDRVGVYGEYSIVEHFAANRKAVWYWQTYAWSGGRWSQHNHIEQYHNGVSLAGATLDLDRALTTDFGQWTTGGDVLTPYHENAILYDNNRLQAFTAGDETVEGTAYARQGAGEQVWPVKALKQLLADVAELKARPPVEPAPVDPAALAAAVREALASPISDEQLERVLRKVIGSVDGSTPA